MRSGNGPRPVPAGRGRHPYLAMNLALYQGPSPAGDVEKAFGIVETVLHGACEAERGEGVAIRFTY